MRAQPVASSRCCLGLVEGPLSGVGIVLLRSGCARRIVLVCRRLSWAGALLGLLSSVPPAGRHHSVWARRHVRLVLLVWCRLRLLSVGVLGWLWSAVGLQLPLCCLPSQGWCCVGSCPPLMLGPIVLVCGPPMVGRALLVRGSPWVGRDASVCAPPRGGRAVLACGPPRGQACCVIVGPRSWWDVLCWCVTRLMVLVPARRGGCACCGGVELGLWSSMLPADRRHWDWVGRVLASALCGLFCSFGVVFAALRSACSGGCGRQPGCGCGCVVCLAGVCAVLVRGPPHGWVCCVCVCPPPW